MSKVRATILPGFLFALSWLAHIAQAQASTYCVGDSLALVNALNSALNSSGPAVIQIQQNATAYDLKDSVLKCVDQTYGCGTGEPHSFNSLKLLGGYTDSSCSSRSLDSSKTIFDSGGQAQGISMLGDLRVEGLHFTNFKNWTFQLHDGSNSGNTISVLNNIFSGGDVNIDTSLTSGQNLRVLTNLIDHGGLSLIAWDNTDQVTITGNTIVNATSYGMNLCLYNGTADVTNNTVWNNAQGILVVNYPAHPEGCGSSVGSGTVKLSHNIYQAFGGILGSGSGSNSTSDPQFVAVGDYHLQASSPAINAGDGTDPGVTGTDLDGNPRVVGSEPDIGAYESGVIDNAPTTLTVTNTNDDTNPGSLRWAIASANATGGSHTIEFNLTGGSCPYVINLSSDLPQITDPYLTINGFSQPGSKPNVLDAGDNAVRCVVLNGGNAVSYGPTFVASSPSLFWIQGLAFEGFTGTALNLSNGQGDIVWGNQFGGKMDPASGGLQLTPNAIDIWVYGSTTTALIGGVEPSNRNIIAGADGSDPNYGGRGIAIPSSGGSKNNSIIGNLIGMDYLESTTGGNKIGVQVETSSNTISGNVIGNNNNGIQVLGAAALGNKIQHNRVGISDPYCIVLLGCFDGASIPDQAGIYIWQGATLNLIQSNTIANNSIFGIELIDGGTYENPIVGNSIFGNALEIDLNGFTYGYNDPASTAPNRGLNYPIVYSNSGGTASGTMTGVLQSSNGGYTIDLFSSPACDASGYGGGKYFLGTTDIPSITNATAGHNGTVIFTAGFNAPPGTSLAGQFITATASDDQGNTSQFSACQAYDCDVIFRHGFDTAAGEKCP